MQLGNIIEEIFVYYDVNVKGTTKKSIQFVCPFHSGRGRDANAIIHPDDGFWKCLNPDCGAKGYLQTLIKRLEGCKWDAAKVILKERFELDLDEMVFLDDDIIKPEYRYYKIPAFYREASPDNPYLQEHGFTWRTFDKLHIGEVSYDPEMFVLPYYYKGSPVGYAIKPFKGRANYPKQFPVNKFLYAYDIATPFDHIYVVEGQRDVWRLLEHGLAVVGLNSASASHTQIKMLISNWKRVTICLDGDKAGIAGAINLFQELKGLVEVDMVLMPYLQDPESIRNKEEFLSCQKTDDMAIIKDYQRDIKRRSNAKKGKTTGS